MSAELVREDLRIRSLRGPKVALDPNAPQGIVVEDERRLTGVERTVTVFLTGAECPFTCSYCDLWRYTLDGPTPPGAIGRQLTAALGDLTDQKIDRLKLYNASNFFDRNAVPPADLEAIVRLSAPFAGVTVESHARTIDGRCRAFADRLTGRLEVALGLETIHPEALRRLNKKMTLDQFDRAADRLAADQIDLRAFVLLGAPHVPDTESVEWTVRSVAHAQARGARFVAIIPVRGGNGELERLASQGAFVPPRLDQMEEALRRCLELREGVTVIDLWEADRLASCPACGPRRLERLRRVNISGRWEPLASCDVCGEAR